MKKLRFYLDTSILNFFYAEDVPVERALTKKFFEHINRYDAFVSDLVLEEIDRCQALRRQKLFEVISKYELEQLPLDESAKGLADKYVAEGIVPQKYYADALHIAIATVHRMDVLLRWNFQHMVKLKTKREVAGINLFMGYQTIEIVSPKEVVDDV